MFPLCLYCWKCVHFFLNEEFNCSSQLELNVLCFLAAWFLRWDGMSWDTAETLSSLHLCIFSPQSTEPSLSPLSVWLSSHSRVCFSTDMLGFYIFQHSENSRGSLRKGEQNGADSSLIRKVFPLTMKLPWKYESMQCHIYLKNPFVMTNLGYQLDYICNQLK